MGASQWQTSVVTPEALGGDHNPVLRRVRIPQAAGQSGLSSAYSTPKRQQETLPATDRTPASLMTTCALHS